MPRGNALSALPEGTYVDPKGVLRRVLPEAVVAANKARANRSGSGGEALVKAQHDECYRRGVAHMRKVPTETAGKNGERWFRERSGVDFKGMLRGGRACYVEVKTCNTGKRFYLSFVEPHQRAELDDCHQFGGLALVVLVRGNVVMPRRWVDVRSEVSLSLEPTAEDMRWNGAYLQRFLARRDMSP